MKSPKALALLLLLALAFPAFGQSPPADKEIRAALATWNDRANRADLDSFMQLFDDSENLLVVGSAPGEVMKGKTAIRTWLSGLFAHNKFSWDLSNPIIDSNGNTAWVFLDGAMTVVNDKGETHKSPYRFSGVMVKKNGVWKWRMFHGSVPEQEH